MVLKNEVQVTTGFFRGKECINENLNTWFFPEFERKTAPRSVNFFWQSVKRQSMTAGELSEEKIKIDINFDNLCHKFLTWVSFLLSTCPRELFEEENVSINCFSITFFRAGIFFDFWVNSFRQRCQTCNLCDWGCFLMKCFFGKTCCLYDYSQKLSGRFLNFCPFFWQQWQTCIPRVRGKIPRKIFFLTKKSYLFSDFDPQKFDSEKQLGMFVKTTPYVVGRTFGANFLNLYLVA